MKQETAFRMGHVNPFLKTLRNTFEMSIQQMAIHGHPDKVLCSRGQFVAMELKARGGALRPLQIYVLGQIRAAGGIVIVADPDNWDRVKKALTQLDKGEPWSKVKSLLKEDFLRARDSSN